jgi:hypothetical protein
MEYNTVLIVFFCKRSLEIAKLNILMEPSNSTGKVITGNQYKYRNISFTTTPVSLQPNLLFLMLQIYLQMFKCRVCYCMEIVICCLSSLTKLGSPNLYFANLSSCHTMEEILLWPDTRQESAINEPTSSRRDIIGQKGRQCSSTHH